MNINPTAKIAKSEGVDLPIMNVYLAGRIAGDCIDKCLGWRDQLIEHYRNYKPIYSYKNCNINDAKEFPNGKVIGYESYPIAFLCPLNSGEAKSVDAKGLTSAIPPNLIYDKDLLSVEKADVVVANMNDFREVGIEDSLTIPFFDTPMNGESNRIEESYNIDYKKHFWKLRDKIVNYRENLGTISEVAWTLYLQKPLILIVPVQRKETYEKHPFMRRASVIVTSTDELIKEKHLNTIYKAMAGAIYR